MFQNIKFSHAPYAITSTYLLLINHKNGSCDYVVIYACLFQKLIFKCQFKWSPIIISFLRSYDIIEYKKFKIFFTISKKSLYEHSFLRSVYIFDQLKYI